MGDRWRRIEDRLFRSDRLTLYGAALAACYAIFLATGYFRHLWIVDPDGRGIAIDFVATWAAARLAMAGYAASAYDVHAITREQLQGVGMLVGRYPWAYPPTYTLAIAPFGLLPYATAALVWIAATLAAYLATIRAITRRPAALVLAAASPFALWSAYAGQNGFLFAALIGGALINLDRRPILAGIFLGLLTWKPQLGILFPLVLALTGRWRCFASAGVTFAALAAASLLVFGADAWSAFLESLRAQGTLVLANGEVPWSKLQSVFALVRWAGGGAAAAWILHGAATFAAVAFVVWTWRKPVAFALKAAALATAALVATPYLFLYDLPILSVPIAFLVREGMTGGYIVGERTLLALLAVALLGLIDIPVGTALLALLMAVIALRVRRASARHDLMGAQSVPV